MSLPLDALPAGYLDSLGEPHLAVLATPRPDGGAPHVAVVGVTYDPDERVARILTRPGSFRVGLIGDGAPVTVSQVVGPCWMALEGEARTVADGDRVADALARYERRYGPPPQPDAERVVTEITVRRVYGQWW